MKESGESISLLGDLRKEEQEKRERRTLPPRKNFFYKNLREEEFLLTEIGSNCGEYLR